MTTILMRYGHRLHDEPSTVNVSTASVPPSPGSYEQPPDAPITLGVFDAVGDEGAAVFLSPAKAREVIAALQAAVDEVEPPGPPKLVRGNRPDHSRDSEIADRLKAKGGILFDVWYILHDYAYGLDEIADRFVEGAGKRPSENDLMDALSQLQMMRLVEQLGDVPWTWQRPRAVVKVESPAAVLPPRERP